MNRLGDHQMEGKRDLESSYQLDRETSRATQGQARRRWATVVATVAGGLVE